MSPDAETAGGCLIIILFVIALFGGIALLIRSDVHTREASEREASACAIARGYYVQSDRICLAGVDSVINVRAK